MFCREDFEWLGVIQLQASGAGGEWAEDVAWMAGMLQKLARGVSHTQWKEVVKWMWPVMEMKVVRNQKEYDFLRQIG